MRGLQARFWDQESHLPSQDVGLRNLKGPFFQENILVPWGGVLWGSRAGTLFVWNLGKWALVLGSRRRPKGWLGARKEVSGEERGSRTALAHFYETRPGAEQPLGFVRTMHIAPL